MVEEMVVVSLVPLGGTGEAFAIEGAVPEKEVADLLAEAELCIKENRYLYLRLENVPISYAVGPAALSQSVIRVDRARKRVGNMFRICLQRVVEP